MEQEIFKVIQSKLYEESNKHYQKCNDFATGIENKCKVNECNNKVVSKGYCNAHYLRYRHSKDLSLPIKNRRSDIYCSICGKKLNGKGGWNLCRSHYKKERRRIIQRELINHLGGKCSICGNSYPMECYDFHHKNRAEKDKGIGILFDNASLSKIIEEALKCDLVCANCHRTIHYG